MKDYHLQWNTSRLRDHTVQQIQKAVLSTLKVCSEKSVVETRTVLPTEKENLFFSKTKVNKGPNIQALAAQWWEIKRLIPLVKIPN